MPPLPHRLVAGGADDFPDAPIGFESLTTDLSDHISPMIFVPPEIVLVNRCPNSITQSLWDYSFILPYDRILLSNIKMKLCSLFT